MSDGMSMAMPVESDSGTNRLAHEVIKWRAMKTKVIFAFAIAFLWLAYTKYKDSESIVWYQHDPLSYAKASEWQSASDEDRLATSANFALRAMAENFGSVEEAAQRFGTMDKLHEHMRPLAMEIKDCITAETAKMRADMDVFTPGRACSGRIIEMRMR
jgi:hypothetical protein